jgi:hypothetical protein
LCEGLYLNFPVFQSDDYAITIFTIWGVDDNNVFLKFLLPLSV